MELHTKIKLIRKSQKLSQKNIADKLNISQKGYSKIEANLTALNLNRIEELAKIYNLTLWELILVDVEILIKRMQHPDKAITLKSIDDINALLSIYESKLKALETENKLLKKELSTKK